MVPARARDVGQGRGNQRGILPGHPGAVAFVNFQRLMACTPQKNVKTLICLHVQGLQESTSLEEPSSS